jgi:hypothetical protein
MGEHNSPPVATPFSTVTRVLNAFVRLSIA